MWLFLRDLRIGVVGDLGESMLEWMLLPFRRYFDFEGRSRRMEYWSFHLLGLIVSLSGFALMVLGAGNRTYSGNYDRVENGISTHANYSSNLGTVSWVGLGLLGLWALVSFIPSIALTVRRLHDRDKNGLYMLLTFIPLIGLIFAIIMLVNFFMEGTTGPNRYGPDPKGIAADTSVFN